MTQEQKSYAVRKMREISGNTLTGTIVFIVLFTIAVTFPCALNNIWYIFAGIFMGLVFGTLARIHRIIFIMRMRMHASYLEKHDVGCYVLPIYKYGNSPTNFLENWRRRQPNLAFFRFREKSYKMYVHRIFSLPNNNQAIVFEDETSGKVFGIPGAYLPDIEDAYKENKYYFIEGNKTKTLEKPASDMSIESTTTAETQETMFRWGDEEVVEKVKPKKNNKTRMIAIGAAVLTVLCMGICIITYFTNGPLNIEGTAGKSEQDVAVLEEIFIAQREADTLKIPLKISYNLDSNQYRWEDGRLVGIYWDEMGLQAPLDLSGLSALEEMSLVNNHITGICFGDNDCLQAIDLSNNPTGSVTVGKECPNLKILICQQCDLSNGISVSDCENLEELYCKDANVKELDLKGNPNLSILVCKENNIVELDLSNNPMLSIVDCAGNELEVLDVSANKELTMLGCSENKLKELDVSANVNLNILECGNNNILEIDVSNNASLRELNVTNEHKIKVIGANKWVKVYD